MVGNALRGVGAREEEGVGVGEVRRGDEKNEDEEVEETESEEEESEERGDALVGSLLFRSVGRREGGCASSRVP